MAPSETTPQELSNEWSCQYVPKITLGNFVLLLMTEVTISP
jgi:hypothetical protein